MAALAAGLLTAWVGFSPRLSGDAPPPKEAPDPGFTVLCYHRFTDPLAPGEKAPSSYHLPVDEFEWQMGHLKERGIVPVTLEAVRAYLEEGEPLPEKAVLLTIDDGFESVASKAYPILKKYGYPGVLFLYTDFIRWQEGRKPEKDGDRPKKERAMTLAEIQGVRDLLAVESHTKGHLNLAKEGERKRKADYASLLRTEMEASRDYLLDKFGIRSRVLAYPYGVYTPEAVEAVRAAGYGLSFTVNPGPNDRSVERLKLKRNLILYPLKREAFAALFGSRVLHLDRARPGDGEVLDAFPARLEAVLKDEVDPATLSLKLGNKELKASYDPATRTVAHSVTKPLRNGGHMMTVEAIGHDGVIRTNTWYFRVNPAKAKE